MKPIPMVDLEAQYAGLKHEIDAAIARVLQHRQFILGPEVEAFEAAFAAYVGARRALGVSSGTAALRLALQACGVGPGDRVITVAHSFIATAEAVSHLGAEPVFVDIDPQTYNIDPRAVAQALETHERVRALLPVHLYGQPAEMDPLLALAGKHGLHVVEDAAQAHGAAYRGRRCGSLGHLAAFSFYPGKNLGAYGDAGMVTGDDEALVTRVGLLRDHGRTARYEHQEVGWSERMDGLQGAVLAVKLPCLEDWTEARRRHAARLDGLLAEVDEVTTPYAAPHVRHVYHLYTIRARERDALRRHLNERGVAARLHNALPLDEQPAYRSLRLSPAALPVTRQVAAESLSLPMFPELSDEQLVYIAEEIKAFYATR